MEKFNEIDLTAEDSVPREMGLRRAVFLLIASLSLWCGSMLLVLDLDQRQRQSGASSVDRPFFGSNRRQLFMG